MKNYLEKVINVETMLYLFFGMLTTFVNFGIFVIVNWLIGEEYYLISNICSFVCATIFAYITNKQYVFKSKEWYAKIVLREFITFVSARIISFLIIEEAGLLFAVEVLGVNNMVLFSLSGTLIAKVFLAFLAVLINYVLSKFFIFKQRRKKDESCTDNSCI